jgi:hypothetical protein
MPVWRIPTSMRRASKNGVKGAAQVTFSMVDLTKRCVCGCCLGSHYFLSIPGGPMCSTCDSCAGFVAMETQPEQHGIAEA